MYCFELHEIISAVNSVISANNYISWLYKIEIQACSYIIIQIIIIMGTHILNDYHDCNFLLVIDLNQLPLL